MPHRLFLTSHEDPWYPVGHLQMVERTWAEGEVQKGVGNLSQKPLDPGGWGLRSEILSCF